MDISLQTALFGAVMGSAVLAFAMVYGCALPAAPSALRWWAAAFTAQTASYAVVMGNNSWPGKLWLADSLHGVMGVLVLTGTIALLKKRISPQWVAIGILAAAGWGAAADALRLSLALPGLPLFGLGGLPLLVTAWAFLTHREGHRADGHMMAAAAFAISALHEFAAPVLHVVPWLAPLSFVFAQMIAIITAISLMVVVLRRQQLQAETETARANRLQGQFIDAIESISEGFVLFDSDDRLVLCNSHYRKLLAPINDLLLPGTPFADIARAAAERDVVPAARGRSEQWIAERMKAHRTPRWMEEQELQDGRWMMLREYRTGDGGTVGIRREITERKLAERALRESEQRLRGIMDTVVDGIITIDKKGTVQSFNPAAERIFGYAAAEVIGNNVNMLMPEPYHSGHDGYLSNYLTTGEARIIGLGRQVQGRRKDGGIFPLELAVSELRRDESVTFIGVVRDITDRKRVEEALLESEQRFRDLAEAASDWFWETGPDLHFIFVSSRVRQVLGVKTAFFIGKTFHDFAESSDEPHLWQDHLATLEARGPFRDFVFKQVLPDGRIKYLKTSGRPVFDANNEFRGYRGTGTDITAEIEAKAFAERAQNQLMAALESITEGFVLWDSEDRLALCNSKYREFYPDPAIDVAPGVTFTDLAREIASRGCATEARGRVEEWVRERVALHRNPSGSSIELSMSNGQWLLSNERLTRDGYVVGVYTDITPIKRREQEVAAKTALLQAIIDNMPQGISVFDAQGQLVAFNRMAIELFAIPPEMAKAGSSTYEDFVRLQVVRGEFGDGPPEVLVRERLEATRNNQLESERQRPDGTAIEIRRNAMPDGGFLASYTDITERKRAELVLREAKEAAERGNRAKAAFLASISHELRTPLNAIIGFSEVMLGELFGPVGNDHYREYTKDIYDSGSHLLNLINDILDMSKAEAGKIDLDETEMDVAQAAESSVRLLRKRAENARIDLTVTIPADLPPLHADERRIKQIMLNLLSNAIKFTDDGGSVTLSAAIGDEGMTIVIADTGIGMEPQDISNAMLPFHQVDSRLSRKYEGTGLGLPLTKALIEAHGGKLELRSAFGVGTTAYVTFPPSRIVIPAVTVAE